MVLSEEKQVMGDPSDLSGMSAEVVKPAAFAALEIIREMKGITLEELAPVRLMNRSDIKYILPVSGMPRILQKIADAYYVQDIDGKRIASYETVYYDTPAFKFYHEHVNGKLNRFKIRRRSYLDCDSLHFLEVKRKTNTGKTKKNRIKLENGPDIFDESAYAHVAEYGCTDLFLLFPVLLNRFKRITLVNTEKTERITIDFDISYSKIGNGKEIHTPYFAIIEIKREKNSFSTMRNVLCDERIKKAGFSKYCAGLSLLEPVHGIKSYKRILRYVKKISDHELIA